MKKIILLIATLNLLINTSCFFSRSTPQAGLVSGQQYYYGPYEKYENPGFIHGIGYSSNKFETDKSKCLAIAIALEEMIIAMNADEKFLAQINRDKQLRTALEASKAQDKPQGKFLESFEETEITGVSSTAFGNVNLYRLNKRYPVESYSIDSIYIVDDWVFESIIKLSYTRDDKSLIFENYLKEIPVGLYESEIIDKFFFVKKDFSIDELLKELEDYGFRYEFDHSQEKIYLLLDINRELLLSKQNIDNVSSTIKLEASEA